MQEALRLRLQGDLLWFLEHLWRLFTVQANRDDWSSRIDNPLPLIVNSGAEHQQYCSQNRAAEKEEASACPKVYRSPPPCKRTQTGQEPNNPKQLTGS